MKWLKLSRFLLPSSEFQKVMTYNCRLVSTDNVRYYEAATRFGGFITVGSLGTLDTLVLLIVLTYSDSFH